ncbi:MAG: thioredoxin family protein [Acidobacteria bacterium]|nr:thioredoxin family protein [Acidobacteriota bacterium]
MSLLKVRVLAWGAGWMLAMGAVQAAAQTPVHWSLKVAPAGQIAPGGSVTATATAAIDPGWHVYALTQGPGGPHALEVTVQKSPVFSLGGKPTSPLPTRAFDPNFNMETEFHADSAEITIPIKIAKPAPGGPAVLSIDMSYQTCNERLCLPPAVETLTAQFDVQGPGSTVPSPSTVQGAKDVPGPGTAQGVSAPDPGLKADVGPRTSDLGLPRRQIPDMAAASAQAASFLNYVLLAAAMGFLSLLTPCVFPMVPITVSYFTARAGRTRREAVTQALVYGAGIVMTFSAVGLALALFLGASGLNQFAANPWVNLGITALFLGFALSLFGTVNIALPSSMVTKAVTAEQGRGNFVGTLLMGFAFTLTSFTCTAPFIGSLLVVAATGNWQWPLAGMLAFSSVFALPFVILAIVPQRLASLPRAGAWLAEVKTAMGLLEVAAAMKFLSNVDLVWGWGIFTRNVVLASWVIVAVLLMAQFLRGKRSTTKIVLAVASLVLAVWLGNGIRGARLGELEAFLPPAEASLYANGKEPEWIVNNYDEALAVAKRENRPVLIDFTGYTCTNCRWMEANMFPRPEVAVELARYVRVRLYTDGQGEPYLGYQRMQRDVYGTVALPYYAALDADGTPQVAFGGLTRNSAEFVAFLRKGLE